MEEFEVDGIWWLPQFEQHKIAGKLKFHPVDGAELSLIGDDFSSEIKELFGYSKRILAGGEFYSLPERIEIEIILGYTSESKAITLYRCWETGMTHATEFTSQSFRVQVVFSQYHFVLGTDIVFNKLVIEYTYLDQWLGKWGFVTDANYEGKVEYSVNYVQPAPLELQINDLKIAFRYSSNMESSFIAGEVKVKRTPYIEIIPPQPMHYSDYQGKVIYHLRNFLNLGVGTTILPISMKATNEHFVIEPKEGEKVFPYIDIFYSARGSKLGQRKPETYPNKLFSYDNIAGNFQKYLQNWFIKAEKLRPVIDQYFGLFYIPSTYLHLEFLTLSQAIETYHRRIGTSEFMTSKDYAPIKNILEKAIPDNLADEHRNRLEDLIRYGYEYSLRTRLTLLLDEVLAPYNAIIEKLISDRSDFIKKFINTRNYLTHYGEDSKAGALLNTDEQYVFIQKMKLLLQLCFFLEMDFPFDVVENIMSKNWEFQHWSRK